VTKRGIVTAGLIVTGLTLMILAYFAGAAPWCNTAVECSNPRLEWSSAIFVVGVIVSFSSALYYSMSKSDKK
jgi:hypothetical protein